MDRREIIKYIGLITGAVVVGGDAFLMGCRTDSDSKVIVKDDFIKLFEELAEVILPKTTNLVGAKDVQVGKLMVAIVENHYSEVERKSFLEGLQTIGDTNFMLLDQMEKQDYIMILEKESAASPFIKKIDEHGNKIQIPHTYTMIKQLTLMGYLSSETVARTVFNYLPIPGKYEKCVEVDEKTKPMYYRQAPYF